MGWGYIVLDIMCYVGLMRVLFGLSIGYVLDGWVGRCYGLEVEIYVYLKFWVNLWIKIVDCVNIMGLYDIEI